jgi:hypothetical protein
MIDRNCLEFFFPYFLFKESNKKFKNFLSKYLEHPRNRKFISKGRKASVYFARLKNLFFNLAKAWPWVRRFRIPLDFFFLGRDQRLVGDLGLKKRSSVCFSNFFFIPKKEFGLFLGIKKKFVFRSLGYVKPSFSGIIFKDYFKNRLSSEKYSFGFQSIFFGNVYFYKDRSSYHGLDFSVSFYNGLCSKFSLLKTNEFFLIKDFNFGSFVSISKSLRVYRNCLKRFSRRGVVSKRRLNLELFLLKNLYNSNVYANHFIQLNEYVNKFNNLKFNNFINIKLLIKLLNLFTFRILLDMKCFMFLCVLFFFDQLNDLVLLRVFLFVFDKFANVNKNVSHFGVYRNKCGFLVNVVTKKPHLLKLPFYVRKVIVTDVKVKDFYYVFGYFLTMLYQKSIFDTTSLKNNLFFFYKHFGIIKRFYKKYFKNIDIFGLRYAFLRSKLRPKVQFKLKRVSVFFKLISIVSNFNQLKRLMRNQKKFKRI